MTKSWWQHLNIVLGIIIIIIIIIIIYYAQHSFTISQVADEVTVTGNGVSLVETVL